MVHACLGSFALPVFSPLRLADAEPFDHAAALARCAQGDRAALRRLYEREASFLMGVALRIVRDRATAEDVLHDAFLNIWTRAATFDARRGAGRAWMYGIVRHRALDAVRSGARTVSADEEQLDALQAMGCDLIQGYYFSRPLPKEEFICLLERQTR